MIETQKIEAFEPSSTLVINFLVYQITINKKMIFFLYLITLQISNEAYVKNTSIKKKQREILPRVINQIKRQMT